MPFYEADLDARMRGPQRHRLLHGYPMAPVLRPVLGGAVTPAFDPRRPMILGVLPHTFCNPAVTGCGFCTFPHERFGADAAREVSGRVGDEVDQVVARWPALASRRIDAVYFGGGTANLTPPDAFAALGQRLAARFVLRGAEVTLEGIPALFLARDGAMLHALRAALPARQRRISMGVQTFDPAWLARMGRAAFGTRDEIARVVARAHAMGMTTSADLLYNLPGQAREAMLDDVRTAAAMGLDQICVYNLVLAAGLGTAWSRDATLLAQRPGNAVACANWLAVRDLLFALGYVQSTLTNFERADVAADPQRRFAYERASFHPEAYDALGVGPGAISCFTAPRHTAGLKWSNVEESSGYLTRVARGRGAVARSFAYAPQDLELLYLTRKLALGRVPREGYRTLFDVDVCDEYAGPLAALEQAGLLTVEPDALALTPTGMFYADSVAGLLAAERTAELRRDNDATMQHMG